MATSKPKEAQHQPFPRRCRAPFGTSSGFRRWRRRSSSWRSPACPNVSLPTVEQSAAVDLTSAGDRVAGWWRLDPQEAIGLARAGGRRRALPGRGTRAAVDMGLVRGGLAEADARQHMARDASGAGNSRGSRGSRPFPTTSRSHAGQEAHDGVPPPTARSPAAPTACPPNAAAGTGSRGTGPRRSRETGPPGRRAGTSVTGNRSRPPACRVPRPRPGNASSPGANRRDR